MAAMKEKNKQLHEQLDAYMAISSANIFVNAKNIKDINFKLLRQSILVDDKLQ